MFLLVNSAVLPESSLDIRSCVTGRVRSDYSNRVHRMADLNYGGNGGRVLTMAALAAAQ
jgi:hypothetical protein